MGGAKGVALVGECRGTTERAGENNTGASAGSALECCTDTTHMLYKVAQSFVPLFPAGRIGQQLSSGHGLIRSPPLRLTGLRRSSWCPRLRGSIAVCKVVQSNLLASSLRCIGAGRASIGSEVGGEGGGCLGVASSVQVVEDGTVGLIVDRPLRLRSAHRLTAREET